MCPVPRKHNDKTIDELVQEMTEKYDAIRATLRVLRVQLGALAVLKQKLEDAGGSVPEDILKALRRVEARLDHRGVVGRRRRAQPDVRVHELRARTPAHRDADHHEAARLASRRVTLSTCVRNAD